MQVENVAGIGFATGRIASQQWQLAMRRGMTEAVYKIYAESFRDEAHLDSIVSEAQAMVNKALASAG